MMWAPIIPQEEMATDEALLAMIGIFKELGFLDDDTHHSDKLGKNAEKWLVFQYAMCQS